MSSTVLVAIIGAVTTIFGSVVSHLIAKNKYRDDILADGVIMLATNLEVALRALSKLKDNDGHPLVNGDLEKSINRLEDYKEKCMKSTLR